MSSFAEDESPEEVLLLHSHLPYYKKLIQIRKIESMQKLINNDNSLNKEIFGLVKKVVNKCETCINFNKQVPRSTVAFAKAEDFNQKCLSIYMN